MLIITNGDAAVAHLKSAGIEGQWLPWRDVLHDGPVPAGYSLEGLSRMRCQYLAEKGWGEYTGLVQLFQKRDHAFENCQDHSEVLLWFEHDLYDQLQILQVLHWFKGRELGKTRLSIILSGQFITELSADRIGRQYIHRGLVTGEQLELAHDGWEAFCAPEPQRLRAFADQDLSELPFLKTALFRLFEEYPDIRTGLSKNERQILQLLESGVRQIRALFRENHILEPIQYLGDWSFWAYLLDLMRCRHPLVAATNGQPFRVPPGVPLDNGFLDRCLEITHKGREILHGDDNHLRLNGIDKWIGGVHLMPGNVWCWDPGRRCFERVAV